MITPKRPEQAGKPKTMLLVDVINYYVRDVYCVVSGKKIKEDYWNEHDDCATDEDIKRAMHLFYLAGWTITSRTDTRSPDHLEYEFEPRNDNFTLDRGYGNL